VAQKKNITARQKWMIDNTRPKGILYLDSGAVNALKIKKKSLLPVGVIKLTGNFFRGDLLSCLDQDGVEVARGLSNFSSEDAKKIIGKKARTFSDDLENRIDENLIHRDNLVII
jgi:glutamate 5-kinase